MVLFQEDMKRFSTRFLLVPDSTSTSTQVLLERKGDIYTEHDIDGYEERFIRFIEAVNRIRGVISPRGVGLFPSINLMDTLTEAQTSIPVRRKKTASAPQSIGRVRSNEASPTDLDVVIEAWLKYLRENPISICVSKRNIQLPSTIFIAYDLIAWLRSKISIISSKRDALAYANMMLQGKRIRLVPNNVDIDDTESTISSSEMDDTVFKYGFFFYLVVDSLYPVEPQR